MLGLNGIDPSKLSARTVSDVMERDVPTITLDEKLEEILHLLIDQSSIIVEKF